jgi:uncharacterized coiled-coil protein SlyX
MAMSIFAKKQELEQKTMPNGDSPMPTTTSTASKGGYGIAEAIQLLRSLPVDQNPDLVVRVVRATLASLNVRLSDIIEDASKKQKTTQDRIASEHGKIAELEKQLAEHRKEIAALEADLKETTTVKDRLQLAEKSASSPPPLRATPPVGTPHTGAGPASKPPEESAGKD